MKRICIILGVLCLVSCIGCLAAWFVVINPDVQKKVALSVLRENCKTADLERIELDTDSVLLKGLSLMKDGMLIEMGDLTIDYSLVSAIFENHINIHKLKAVGLRVDMREFISNKKEGLKPKEGVDGEISQFQGVFKALENAGIQLTLADVDVRGEVILPSGQILNIKMEGGGIGKSADGEIAFTAHLRDPGESVDAGEVAGHGTVSLKMDDHSLLKAIVIDSRFSHYGLHFTTNLSREENGSGEVYGSSLKSLLSDAVDPVFELTSRYDYDSNAVRGKYDVSMNKKQLSLLSELYSAYLPENSELPEFLLKATGSYSLDVRNKSGSSYATSNLLVANAGQIDPSLSALGEVMLQTEIETSFDNDALTVKKLDANLVSVKEDLTLLKVQLKQEFACPFQAMSGLADISKGELLSAHFNVPLALCSPFVKGIDIKKGQLMGDLLLSAEDKGGLTLSSLEMLEVVDLTTTQDGKFVMKDFGVSIVPEINYNGNSISLSLKEIHMFGQSTFIGKGSLLVEGKIDNGKLKIGSIAGKQILDLDGLLTQPIIARQMTGLSDWSPQMQADYMLRMEDENLVMEKLDMTVLAPGGEQLFDVALLQSLSIPLDGDVPEWSSYSGDLIRVETKDFPLTLVSLLIPDVDIAGKIDDLSATVSSNNDIVAIRTENGIKISDLALSHMGKSLLNQFSISSSLSCNLDSKSVMIKLDGISATQGKSELFSGDARALYDTGNGRVGSTEVSLSIDLAQLLKQPLLLPYNNLKSGKAKIHGNYNPDKNNELNLNLEMKSLITKSSDILKSVKLNYTGELDASPVRVTGEASVLLEGLSRNTDLLLNINYSPEKFNYRLASNNINVNDVNILTSAFSKDVIEAEKVKVDAESQDVEVDTVPFWPAVTGEGDISLTNVEMDQHTLKDVVAKQTISPSQLDIEYLKGQYAGAPIEMNGKFNFDELNSRPYGFKGNIGIVDISLGEALDISKWVNGLYTFRGDLNGRGVNISQLFENIMGELQLTSKDGELTFFNIKDLLGDSSLGPVGKLLGQVVGGVDQGIGVLKGLASAITGKNLGEVRFIADLLNFFQDMKFYDFEILLKRGDNLDLVFDKIRVVGPQTMLSGRGVVAHQDAVAIIDQSLNLDLTLGAKGWVADNLEKIGSPKGEANKMDYYEAFTFPITGSLRKPDASKIKDHVINLGNVYIGNLTTGLLNNFKILNNTNASKPADKANDNNDKSGSNKDSSEKKLKKAVGNILKGFF